MQGDAHRCASILGSDKSTLTFPSDGECVVDHERVCRDRYLPTLLTYLLKAPVAFPTVRRHMAVCRYYCCFAAVLLPRKSPLTGPAIAHGVDVGVGRHLHRNAMLVHLPVAVITSITFTEVATGCRGRGGRPAPRAGEPSRRDTQQQETTDSDHCGTSTLSVKPNADWPACVGC